jgi:ferrous iron transport protein A
MLENELSLRELRPGDRAEVKAIRAPGGMARRLLEIGLIEGTQVECLGRAPSGDPTAFLIRGAVIALRREDCARVAVTL